MASSLSIALIEGQEIVRPTPIGVGFQVGCLACLAYDADIGALAADGVDHIERVRLRLDAGDHLLAGPDPATSGTVRVAQVRDVLVRALRVRFGNTSNFDISHGKLLFFACLRHERHLQLDGFVMLLAEKMAPKGHDESVICNYTIS